MDNEKKNHERSKAIEQGFFRKYMRIVPIIAALTIIYFLSSFLLVLDGLYFDGDYVFDRITNPESNNFIAVIYAPIIDLIDAIKNSLE